MDIVEKVLLGGWNSLIASRSSLGYKVTLSKAHPERYQRVLYAVLGLSNIVQ